MALRAILRHKIRDSVSGYEGSNLFTIEFESESLEAQLRRGGFGESGFEVVELVGVELLDEDKQEG
jgi:hypothetical protein